MTTDRMDGKKYGITGIPKSEDQHSWISISTYMDPYAYSLVHQIITQVKMLADRTTTVDAQGTEPLFVAILNGKFYFFPNNAELIFRYLSDWNVNAVISTPTSSITLVH